MPDIWCDVDSALAEVPVNIMPLLDDTDFKSRETAIAYNAAGMDLVWNFVTTAGAFTQTAVTPTTGGNYDWAHQGDGMYSIEIPASGGATINNDTEGFGWFTGIATGVLPWRGPVIGFRAAGLNNVLIDSAYSATRGLAGTALPDAAADAAGGLPISDAGGLDIDAQIGTDIDAILVDTGTTLQGELDGIQADTEDIQSRIPAALVGGRIDANMGAISGDATAADNLEAAADGTTYNLGGGAVVAASVTGAVGSVTGAVGSVTGAVGSVTGNVGGNVNGSVGSVVGAVGSVTGNVGGSVASVVGAVGSVTGNVGGSVGSVAAGGITAASIATNAIDADALAADAVTEIQSGLATAAALATVDGIVDDILVDTAVIGAAGAGLTALPWNAAWDAEVQSEAADALTAYDPPTNAEMEARTIVAANYATAAALDAVDNFLDTEIADILADTNELQTDWHDGGRLDLILDAASAPSAATVADAVWDEAIAGHLGAGSTGAALNAAGSAGDPWSTAIPGAYGAGTAGKILGDNVNATISSRSSHSAADVWAVGVRTLTSFGTLVADIWAALTSGLSAAGSIGKLLVDNINATISSRLASASYTTPPTVAQIWGEELPDIYGAGTAGRILGYNLDAQVSSRASQTSLNTVDDFLDTEVAAILAAVDTEVTEILADTADMQPKFGVPANLGSGATFAANLTDIEGQTDDIGVAGAGLTAVPWNAAWDAEVQSEATDALNAYDPPTKAELDTAVTNVSVDEIQATALADLFNTDSGTTYAAAVGGSPVKEIADNAGGSALTAVAIRQEIDANSTQLAAIVADTGELQTDWANGGRLDTILDAAGSAGDPWITELPGSYASGTAGYIMSAIQNRIGAFTGSGVNTILGFLKALMSKAASTPSDVGGTFSAATDSTEALRDHLTNAVSVSVTSVANGGTITLYNQADFSQAIALATAIAVGDQLYFSLKQRETDTDDNALLRLSRTGGLVRVNKAAPTLAANGTITVDDATDGDITIAVEASELTALVERSGLVWDVKRITATGAVHNLAAGDATIATAPTKAIT